jgi:xylulokinase
MHNDQRAVEEAQALRSSAASTSSKLGYRMAPSFAAAKILWLQRHEPSTFDATRWFAHQADFISGRLSGEYGITDYSNALKTGYDLVDECWPTWWRDFDGIEGRLPRVVAPGTQIGVLGATVADSLGFPCVAVVSGATDGTAAFLSSGAREAGADNTTLGTTLVFKRLSRQPAAADDGLVYSHKLPGGFWLPGAASNTGGEWIQHNYGEADLGRLDIQSSERFLPCDHVAYPLVWVGERFPFLDPDARGFCHPETSDQVTRYAANLQGTAFVERLCYQALDRATGTEGGDIYATGGASRSDIWLQLRADVTGRRIHRPHCAESAFGSAVMAASAVWHDDVWCAAREMVQVERSFEPDRSQFPEYEDRFLRFRELMEERGYIQPEHGANR